MPGSVSVSGHAVMSEGIVTADWDTVTSAYSPIPTARGEIPLAHFQQDFVVLLDGVFAPHVPVPFRPIEEWASMHPKLLVRVKVPPVVSVPSSVRWSSSVILCPRTEWDSLYRVLNAAVMIDGERSRVLQCFVHSVIVADPFIRDHAPPGMMWRKAWVRELQRVSATAAATEDWVLSMVGPPPFPVLAFAIGGADQAGTWYFDSLNAVPALVKGAPEQAAVAQADVLFPQNARLS
jgi:hypothetical protein